VQAGFHAGDALGKPEALLKVLQAEVISTGSEDVLSVRKRN